MSAKFNGFSEEDINNLRKPKKMPTGNSKLKGKSIVPNKTEEIPHQPHLDLLANDSKLQALHDDISFKSLPRNDPVIVDENVGDIDHKSIDSNLSESKPAVNNNGVNDISTPFKGISLKDFEDQRRLIEEQNRQKKEMLYKAIEQQSERTLAESKKLNEIKDELKKLDNELANDVALLRKQIEQASIQYSQIQKQYEHIESQFLKAKMDLYHASEKKELLTQHLCTIITHNEDRKAKKLTDLMEKVGINSDDTNA